MLLLPAPSDSVEGNVRSPWLIAKIGTGVTSIFAAGAGIVALLIGSIALGIRKISAAT
jgi:hypothetical protein